ncbi:hypothetical protein [Mycolicibacterium lutetiense]|jgi:hypothetical protein|uniref:ESX-1 secretion-associated protein EspH n=1 Tax=Mycolicibacterium lutetiense TaxID=1641992 RepID=A0ABS5A005_9MYCO|nr:hypothetical protein [Mycolicibacterium lutetiense]MBP2455090.1 hypothetical protein [Mycolicibacterium lutetiense]
MMDQTPPGDDDWGENLPDLEFPSTNEDDPSGLDALGDYVPHMDEGISTLDALGEYVSVEAPAEDIDDFAEIPSLASQDDEEPDRVPLFSATNPPGSITVTAYMNGSVQQVELSPLVTKLTESQLAHEIRDLAAIATEKARAGQYVYLLYTAVQQVGDGPAVRNLLTNTLGLPTPEQAAETEAAFLRNYVRNQS